MDKLLEILVASPFAANLLAVIIAIVFIVVAVIYIGAFIQGREITFWPPKIGPATERKTITALASQAQAGKSHIPTGIENDLVEYDLGIEHIWPNRDTWLIDKQNGLTSWHQRMCQAKQVDILSITFWRNWMEKEGFVKAFAEHIQLSETKVRILIYHPGSSILKLRAHHEKPLLDHPEREMQNEITQSLQAIVDLKKQLSENSKNKIEVRLSSFYYLMAQIIRVDDGMIVSNYLSRRGGHAIPTFQVTGGNTKFYKTYQEQFEILWEASVPFVESQFILKDDILQPLEAENDPCLKLFSAAN